MMGSQRVFPFCNADIRMGFYTGMMRHFLPCLIHMYGDSAIYVWGMYPVEVPVFMNWDLIR